MFVNNALFDSVPPAVAHKEPELQVTLRFLGLACRGVKSSGLRVAALEAGDADACL